MHVLLAYQSAGGQAHIQQMVGILAIPCVYGHIGRRIHMRRQAHVQ
jgi:hypothetical protein